MSVGYKCDICKKLYEGQSTREIILTLELPETLLGEPYKPVDTWQQDETSVRKDVCPSCFLVSFKKNYKLP